MVRCDGRRRPRGDEGATSTSGWEATKPLHAISMYTILQYEMAT